MSYIKNFVQEVEEKIYTKDEALKAIESGELDLGTEANHVKNHYNVPTDLVVMTKEEALRIAKEYGLEWEVQTWHDMYIADGMDDVKAWNYALDEWDL